MKTTIGKERNTAKMHKLRRAVERLRNIRATGAPAERRKSWIERLKQRLGLGSESN